MGLKGNLATIHLADVFQILSQGNSSGLLRIQAPEGPRFVEILDGAISIAGRSTERLLLGDLLLSRGFLDFSTLEKALKYQQESGQLLGQILLDQDIVSQEQLEDALRFQIEEEVCELFTLVSGEFDFLANATLDAKIAPGGGMIRLKIDPNELLVEAARRAEEWKVIEQRIPHQSLLFQLTPIGETTLQTSEGISPEGSVLMRLIQSRRTVESIVRKTCLGRLSTNQMLIELWDAGYIELLPLLDYEKTAREHLQLRRYEEALRIALLLAATAEEEGSTQNAAAAQALINDVERTRKLAAQASSVKVMTDPKVRSEIIRRPHTGVILKKERSSTPYAIIAVIVLALMGVGGYVTFYTPTEKVDEFDTHRQLEEAVSKSNDLIAAENYLDGLKVLQEFKSPIPEIKKAAAEAYNKQVKLVESLILHESDAFDIAYEGNKTATLNTVAARLEKMMTVGVNNPEVQALRADIAVKLARYRAGQKSSRFHARLTEILNTAKTQNVEQTELALQAFLSDAPPEDIASVARDEAARLFRLRIEMTRGVAATQRIYSEGHVDFARLEYERIKELFPRSQCAAEAEKGLNAIAELIKKSSAQLGIIENKIAQKKTDDARAELQKNLNAPLPVQVRNRAILLLQTLSPEDPALKRSVEDALQNWDRQPAESRAILLKIVEQAPFSRAAALAVLKTRIVSIPEGAEVFVDGQSLGKTPLTASLLAAGNFVLSLKKAGFQTTTLYLRNVRQESFTIKLDRIPVAQRRMPFPARSGLVADDGSEGERLLFLASAELCTADRSSLKVQERIKLPGLEVVRDSGTPMFQAKAENVFISAAEKALFKTTLTSSTTGSSVPASTLKWMISEQALSAPTLFNSVLLPGQTLVSVATPSGLDILTIDTGIIYKHLTLGNTQAQPSTVGVAEERLLVTRKNSLFSLSHSGEQQWIAPLPGLQANIAMLRHTAAVVSAPTTATAKLNFIALKSGTVNSQRDLKSTPLFGAQAVDQAVLLTFADGRLELHAAEREAPLWIWTCTVLPSETSGPDDSGPIGKIITLQPVIHTPRKLVAVCTFENGIPYINAISLENGQLRYRAPLNSRPVAVAIDAKKIYVSTEDGDVTVFE